MSERGSTLRVPWLLLLAFLLTLMGGAYTYLDARKADKVQVDTLAKQVDRKADQDAVNELRSDVRAIREFLMGPRR